MSACKSIDAGRATRPQRSAGIPNISNQPAASATRPRAITGGTSGTATRFATGEMSASLPKTRSTIGSVATCAASDTPRLSRSGPGRRGTRSSSQLVIGFAQAINPAVAAAESWKPTSATVEGSARSIADSAQASPTLTLEPRPDSAAPTATAAITAARTTDADAPANSV
jgi:hypothetical protein